MINELICLILHFDVRKIRVSRTTDKAWNYIEDVCPRCNPNLFNVQMRWLKGEDELIA